MAGVAGWGAFIPRYRIKAAEFRSALGAFAAPGVAEKAVADVDDDSVTMATSAAIAALRHSGAVPASIRLISLASSSLPYEQKHQVGTIGLAVGAPADCLGLQFAGSSKAGTEALLASLSLMQRTGGCALVAAGDQRCSSIYSPLEHGAGAAGCALVLGSHDVVAELEGSAHFMDDRLGQRFRPSGRNEVQDIDVKEYSEQAVVTATRGAAMRLFQETGLKASDFRHLCFTELDGKMARLTATRIGASEESITTTNLAPRLGDTGVCGVLLGFISALENSDPGDRVLLISYGEGGGADALAFRVCGKKQAGNLGEQIADCEYIDFVRYLKLRGKLA